MKILLGIALFLITIYASIALEGKYSYVLINFNNTSIETNLWIVVLAISIFFIILTIFFKIARILSKYPKKKSTKLPSVAPLQQIQNYLKQNKIAEAIQHATHSLKKSPTPEILIIYPKIVQDLSVSIKLIEKINKKHPNNPYVLTCLGELYVKNKLWGQAKIHLEASIAIKPLAITYALLGEISDKLSNKEQACEYYKLCSQIITDYPLSQEI